MPRLTRRVAMVVLGSLCLLSAPGPFAASVATAGPARQARSPAAHQIAEPQQPAVRQPDPTAQRATVVPSPSRGGLRLNPRATPRPGRTAPRGARATSGTRATPSPAETRTGSNSATPTPTGSAPPAQPTTNPSPGNGDVGLTVRSDGNSAPTYHIEVRNDSNSYLNGRVRQNLPAGVDVKEVNEDGQVGPGGAHGRKISWDVRLPPHGSVTLQAVLAKARTPAVAGPACVYPDHGDRPYDCATAVWGHRAIPASAPWWRHPGALIGAGGGLFTLVLFGWWLRRNWHSVDPAVHGSSASPRRPLTGGSGPRPSPPTWQVIGFATVLLVGSIAGIVVIGTNRVSAITPNAQPTTGAWVGKSVSGGIGEPMRESTFEFTVYGLTCQPQGASRQRCVTTVGLRNLSQRSQLWYGGMQRAYLPDGNWVTTDDTATRAANGGNDIFAKPIPPDGEMLARLVFSPTGQNPPAKIELRSGAFSAGVTVVP